MSIATLVFPVGAISRPIEHLGSNNRVLRTTRRVLVNLSDGTQVPCRHSHGHSTDAAVSKCAQALTNYLQRYSVRGPNMVQSAIPASPRPVTPSDLGLRSADTMAQALKSVDGLAAYTGRTGAAYRAMAERIEATAPSAPESARAGWRLLWRAANGRAQGLGA